VKARGVLAVVLALAFAAVCFRLAFWQIARLHEKQRMNASVRAALTAPPIEVSAANATLPSGARVRLRGAFDPGDAILLRGRLREGEPGVEVVTPWRMAGDSTVVLVDRGWLASEDAATVPAARIPVDTSRAVVGLAETFDRAGLVGALHRFAGGPPRTWSAARLDRDTLGARLGLSLAAWWLRALPDPAAPASPRRDPPEPFNESMHLGYAIQWFAIGLLVPIGGLVLAFRRKDSAGGADPAPGNPS